MSIYNSINVDHVRSYDLPVAQVSNRALVLSCCNNCSVSFSGQFEAYYGKVLTGLQRSVLGFSSITLFILVAKNAQIYTVGMW